MRPVGGELPGVTVREPGVGNLVRRGVESPLRAGAVGVRVLGAGHVAVTIVIKRQVVGRAARLDGAGHPRQEPIQVVVGVRTGVAQGGAGAVLIVLPDQVAVVLHVLGGLGGRREPD